jgi:uncharacterized protein
MEFELENGQATYQIQTYRAGSIVVNDQTYHQSIVVLPEKLIVPWGPDSLDFLSTEHFLLLLPHKPQVVLLGTGSRLCFPSAQIYEALTKQKIGVEVMDTAAACRTYQVLMAEGRQVAAAIIV